MIRFEAPQWIAVPRAELEELIKLPDVFLRVYLYGLMHSDADIQTMASDLGIKQDKLLGAIDELQSRGFLRVEIGQRSRVRYTVREAEAEAPAVLYADAGFNELLSGLFGDRELSYNELRRIYEIIEIYELPKPVVLILVELCINTHQKKNRLPVSFIQERARQWAKSGITTVALANQKMADELAPKLGCRDVLAQMGIYRYPTAEEKRLYDKWTNDWGFTYPDIIAAMSATTRASWPSLKYLDGILSTLHEGGIVTADEIRRTINDKEKTDESIKRLLGELGAPRRTVAPVHREYFEKWSKMGLSEDVMAMACAQAAAVKSGTLEHADAILCSWHDRGLDTAAAVEQELRRIRTLRAATAKMLSAAGVKKSVSDADMRQYTRFSQTYGMPDEVIIFAAECAFGLAAPQKAMEKMLESWHNDGVADIESARARRDAFRASEKRRSGRSTGYIESTETDVTDRTLEYLSRPEDSHDGK